jgi:hypothetical protein
MEEQELKKKVKLPSDKELCEVYQAGYFSHWNRQGNAAQAAGLRAVLRRFGNLSE